ncbi:MAG TPA: cyclopropane-fatty-acyl-phospholipid synthase family protein [Solirubrobacteraceae bacterium]|jgi:cyclopropane-fatty-acyl-phospholipid synthase|nr:cyclopropane-fatty-acyl-phospholipid synthase family protein [Solirubrobacteraceae bacterium]
MDLADLTSRLVQLTPSGTGLLRSEIDRAIPSRPFRLEFWDGTALPATTDDAPSFVIQSPEALAQFLRSPDQLGLGRAYVNGTITVDDLDAAFIVVDTWEPPPIGVAARVRLTAAALAACRPWALPRTPDLELILDGERHTIDRDKEAIRYHYDVGNDFFALFLDPSMTYSCAIFSRGAKTLEEAQRTKLDLVATKLGLKEGDRVLDVGCGWGSFAVHAAREYGAKVLGITISDEQAALGRERIAGMGLSDQIEIRVADYREITDDPFDAIASIGMVEHVGENQIDRYAETLAKLLKPTGVLLNHGIAVLSPDDDPLEDIFSTRYVFPDGEPLALSRIQLAFERAALETHHVEGFGRDYATTLRHWHNNLDARLADAEAIAGVERTRIWRLYLRAARHGFEVGFTNVYQVLARHRDQH